VIFAFFFKAFCRVLMIFCGVAVIVVAFSTVTKLLSVIILINNKMAYRLRTLGYYSRQNLHSSLCIL